MTRPKTTGQRVLLTDGNQRSTLAVARSLGAAGYEVHVCAERRHSLAGVSRYAVAEHLVDSALSKTAEFVEQVAQLVRVFDIAILLPMTEGALIALLPEPDRFPGALIPFAEADTFLRISNKELVLRAAETAGIAIPHQLVLSSTADVGIMNGDAIVYPVVVKPARSVSGSEGQRLHAGAEHAANRHELDAIIRRADASSYPLLIQQRIIGPGQGIFLLLWDGQIIARFAHERIREKPPSGGISVYRKSVVPDETLVERSVTLLRQFDWRGVAMVEYKVDASSGQAYLMEVNGRFWGSLQLAIDAGVDFPRVLVDAALGKHPPAVSVYKTNVRSRWLWGDIDNLIARLRHSNGWLALPPGFGSRRAALRDFFRRHPDDVWEVLRIDDPNPFVTESIQWIQHLFR